MRRRRNAKIVATLGPASSSSTKITKLFQAGVDVFRLNFSHGTHAEHKRVIENIRKLEKKVDRPIGIIADLQGPKLRLGEFAKGRVRVESGASFRLDLAGGPGDETRAPLPHPEVFEALKAGMDLLLDDGKVRLRVARRGPDYAETRVIIGGELSDHKGVNVPSAVLGISSLTKKDRKDLRFALDMGVDWIALSFIQRPDDIHRARRLIDGRAAVMSKLEKPMAIDHLEELVALSDSVMVARGDLGVELAPEEVPGVQKRIILACRHAGKPVVVATQMLDSMVHSPTPTRAEASDVATAVYDGADAVMLSAETAVGDYPVEAVATMDRILYQVARDPLFRRIMDAEGHELKGTAEDAITAAARMVASVVKAAAIVTFTSTGSTTIRASRERPAVPILGLTPEPATARRLALAWGVHSVRTRALHRFSEMVKLSVEVASKDKFAKKGSLLVVTAGVPFGTPGTTNILRIARVA